TIIWACSRLWAEPRPKPRSSLAIRLPSCRMLGSIMTIRRPISSTKTLVILALILALGLALRAWHLGGTSLWLDETHSIRLARFWWKQFWIYAAPVDPNPPLYFTLLKFWLRAFGDSEIAVRSLSVLFGVIGIGAAFLLGRIAGGRTLGLGTAALVAT